MKNLISDKLLYIPKDYAVTETIFSIEGKYCVALRLDFVS